MFDLPLEETPAGYGHTLVLAEFRVAEDGRPRHDVGGYVRPADTPFHRS